MRSFSNNSISPFLLFHLAVRKAYIYYTSKCLVFTPESNIKRDAIVRQYY